MSFEVAVLFARKDSIYKTFPNCDVFDADRDARNYSGDLPVVAHPPCRLWGRLRKFANVSDAEGEKELARFAVRIIRKNGGILEHPDSSLLWPDMDLPSPGKVDSFAGFTIQFPQFWFGHKADKASRFYIRGCNPRTIQFPLVLGEASHVVASRCKSRPEITKAEREHTPIALAKWLIDIARSCAKTK